MKSKLLVIDASVARSAGRTDHPTSKKCREALEAILKICHHMIFTSKIKEEWMKHQSSFSLKWRSTMTAKKKIERKNPHASLISNLEKVKLTEPEFKIIEKDLHLIEAALPGDGIIITLDERFIKTLYKQEKKLNLSTKIRFINPNQSNSEIFNNLE